MTSPAPFAHLHVQSHYSLLEGNCRIPALVAMAEEAEMPALALTDRGTLYGIVDFVKAASKTRVKPIPGMVAFVARNDRREPESAQNITDDLTLLASSYRGYQNLIQLTSKGFTEGLARVPRIDRSTLAQHTEDLLVLSGTEQGEVARALLRNDEARARALVGESQELFGRDQYFLELIDGGTDDHRKLRGALTSLSQATGAPLVVTNNVHYLRPEDALAQEVQLRIGQGRTMEGTAEFTLGSDRFYLRSPAEMAEVFHDQPDALRRTVELADRCHVELPLGERHLPDFPTPDGSAPSDYFRRLCLEGMVRHYGDPIPAKALERLEYEISVIEEMGFVSYFLITWDFIRYARDHDIPVGPGRGSAAGSIVAFSLGITNVCPLKYDLLFERFLNSSRISMPDIDIDFCRDGREEVIHYVRDLYGADHVSQIVTFGTLAARACIRDTGRVLGIDLKEIDRIAKKIPGTPGTKLTQALEDPELEVIRSESKSNRQLFDVALKLEGLNRHASTHAAGVVIGDQPLLQIVPLCTVQGEVNTQFSMNELEDLGLLKMDFLGLKTLTILDYAAKAIKENHGRDVVFDDLPLDDPATYRLLQKGETSAVFQLESSGMRELLVKMHPDCFEDIIAILALYRPGPLGSGMVDSYVNRKQGIETVEYPHPVLEDVLQETRGILVYQEQVMRITNVLAGFSLNEADTLRKAMGKKKPEVMAEFKEKFVKGGSERGCDPKVATEIWETMEYFAGYGFNKSHSTAYGLITYFTAWAKANYPAEFMAAVITCDVANSDKVAAYIQECRRIDLGIDGPDLLHSQLRCTTDGTRIRLGLSTVKGLGEKAIESLIEAREEVKDADLGEILQRSNLSAVNRTALDALVKAGALDWTGSSRASLCDHLEQLLKEAATTQRDREVGQGSLFGGGSAPPVRAIPERNEWPVTDLLRHEKAVFGFYLSSNPLHRYRNLLRRHCSTDIESLGQMEDGSVVTVGGIAGKPRITTTKKGKGAGRKMAIVDLYGASGAVSCVAFPDTYDASRAWIEEDRILLVTGQIDASRDEPSLKLTEVKSLENLLFETRAGQLILDVPGDPTRLAPMLDQLRTTLEPHRGDNPVFLRIQREGRSDIVHRTDDRWFVRISDPLLAEIEMVLGPDCIALH